MPDEATMSIQQAERTDEKLVRGIGVPSLTANIVSSTIGAGIFVIPATIARGLGSAAPLAFVCCAIAMVLFVTCFAIAGSRVSLTGGLYAYVEVAFGRYVGFLAGMLYFLTALGAVAGVVNVLANSVALVVPFFGGPVMRIIVMLAVYVSGAGDYDNHLPDDPACRAGHARTRSREPSRRAPRRIGGDIPRQPGPNDSPGWSEHFGIRICDERYPEFATNDFRFRPRR